MSEIICTSIDVGVSLHKPEGEQRGREIRAAINHRLGPAFEIHDSHRDEMSVFPVAWNRLLDSLDDDARADNIQGWRDDMLERPDLLAQTTITAAQAAHILVVTRPWINKLCDENRIRSIKLERVAAPSPWRDVASKAKSHGARLVHIADILMLAAERLQSKEEIRIQHVGTASHIECENPDCDFEVTAGTTCPDCGRADLKRC